MAPDEVGCACGRVTLKRGSSAKTSDGVEHRDGLPCRSKWSDQSLKRLSAQAQPKPVGEGLEVEPVLVALIRQRTAEGRKKYGTPLRTRNGRDALVDALQESLDMNQYLMQRVMELQDDLAQLQAKEASRG